MAGKPKISKCTVCLSNLTKSQASVQCSKCKNSLHVKCSGLTDLEIEVLHTLKNNFFCEDCKNQAKINIRRSSILPSSAALSHRDKNGEDILECMNELRIEIRDLRNDIKFYAEQYDEQKEKNALFSKEILVLKKENQFIKSELSKLEGHQQIREEQVRSCNAVIMGIKSTPDEINSNKHQVEKRAEKVLKYIDPNLQTNNIKIRILAPLKENTPMLITFGSEEEKQNILMKRKQIGKISSDQCGLRGLDPIYVNEDLSKEARMLFLTARSLREHGFQFIWSRGGKVFARKQEGGAALRIKSVEDIENIKQMAS